MRPDLDFSPPATAVLAVHRAWFWRWACAGVLIGGFATLFAMPFWGVSLSALLWLLGGAVWFKRDVEAPLRQWRELRVGMGLPAAARPETVDWQNWVGGWYWETDAQHRLQVFKPGHGHEQGLNIDWPVLADFVQAQPVLTDCWSGGSAHESFQDCGALRYGMGQRLGWQTPLVLAWPGQLKGLFPRAPGLMCELRAAPTWSASGDFQGFAGVMVPVVPDGGAEVAGSSLAPVDMVEGSAMSEAEQDVLRYALSHDLRAPLRVVDGFTRIVKEDYANVLGRIGNDHLDRVLAAASRMNGMIDAILAQAQLAGAPLARVDVDVSALAQEVGGEMAGLLSPSVSAQLVVQPCLRAQADALLIRRILENLIGNALKYSAKVASPCVEVGAMPATNPTVYYVRDNGAGFDMQHAEKLFGLFQRLHSAKEFPGTGVGLAGVQNIVRRHGGRVWAEARPGDGACFYFTLMDAASAQQR